MFRLGGALLLRRNVFRLALSEFRLLTRFGFPQRALSRIEDHYRRSGFYLDGFRRRYRLGRRHRRRRRFVHVALNQHTLLAYLDLDGSCLTHRIGFFNFRCLLAGQGDPGLRLFAAVGLAQIIQQQRLVVF